MSRVLVIDDEIDICESLCRALELGGHEAVYALDGEAGLKICRERPADIVITDVIMPGRHGVEIIEELRAEFPQIGIIAVSGGGNLAVAGYQPDAIKTAAYMAAAQSAGANYCLTKPFERSELLDRIADLTSGVIRNE